MDALVIAFTNDYATACRLRDDGYEPIECAFGQHGSVMGRLNMDHHGAESHREGVALRACRDLYAARKRDPRFVVTGTPDADAVLAIVALAGLVPKASISEAFYTLVDRQDVDPIGLDVFAQPAGVELAWFNQRPELHPNEGGFRRAIGEMVRVLTEGLPAGERERAIASDRNRRRKALEGIVSLHGWHGETHALPAEPAEQPVCRGALALEAACPILIVHSTVWGFDVWYRLAPLVVSYATRQAKVTLGCPDRDTAERLFGPGGLLTVWPTLGVGWGGRESVGGSPRGVSLKLADALSTARLLTERLVELGHRAPGPAGPDSPSSR